MILQNVLLKKSAEERGALYARTDGEVRAEEKGLRVGQGAGLKFDTYFGSFSIGKWSKYTVIKHFSLRVEAEGEYLLEVFCRTEKEEKKLFSSSVTGTTVVPIENADGVVYFTVRAISDVLIFSANYRTEEAPPFDVNICAIICTYKREDFVKKNVKTLSSLAHGALEERLHVLVVDNGGTLTDKMIETDRIGDVSTALNMTSQKDISTALDGTDEKAVPVATEKEEATIEILRNKNVGGAGGFTRGLIEGMARKNQYGFSHYLLMDDDVDFEPETVYRTYTLLSYRKPEYTRAFVSGGMLRLDKPTIQSEGANFWDYEKGAVVPLKHGYDLSDFDNVIKNETEEEINYSSWWYCAMPTEIPTEDDLPLPLFIKRDDVEYGLRNGRDFFTLNGIGIWHEPFEKKRPAALEYYYVRNRLVMDFSLGRAHTKKYYAHYLLREILLSCLRFRYNEADAMLLGAEDFLRGTEWLKNTDPTATNDLVRGYNATLRPVTEQEVAACTPPPSSKGRWTKVLRIITANGWLLLSKRTVLVPLARPSYKFFFMAKRALNYDPETKTGYTTERRLRPVLRLLRQYRKVKRDFFKKYDILLTDYRQNGDSLKSISFWKKYLEPGDK
ncbi:MAG: glycosyltransferase [Clostridia bacterium]|nr:glycosyltransferase [Clostridia bacterium]